VDFPIHIELDVIAVDIVIVLGMNRLLQSIIIYILLIIKQYCMLSSGTSWMWYLVERPQCVYRRPYAVVSSEMQPKRTLKRVIGP